MLQQHFRLDKTDQRQFSQFNCGLKEVCEQLLSQYLQFSMVSTQILACHSKLGGKNYLSAFYSYFATQRINRIKYFEWN